ncbi:MAG: hypothetical protein GTO45_24830 [Candidatus Aminicenantes bacterium]|nr:hypothetical protein [Candidatus Aminicenantes bacterium]NIM81970.1 hypothetical protein [Candidatus Aminicenantes bacterium]NIN21358.1 hypothetical protein [Candidatus Aminicenantes bacterium]NIN45179.1 hypothetical protein [Candidatus Aminicenantes bacterium]NIN87996.1 hypothetical protein [Candidatus Aminicenantes bacterium]
MKQMKFRKKLRFNKETIADLNIKEMSEAHGGGPSLALCSNPCIPTYTACQTQCPSKGSELYCCQFC